MLQLQVMRHGKSDWDASYGADHDRPLAERGVRSARLMGRVLSSIGEAPEMVISSTAVRAHRTALLAAESGGWDSEVVTVAAIYGGGPGTVRQAIAESAGAVRRVMVVGHEPTWSTLVHDLTGARVEMKTATVAGIGLVIDDWAGLADASGWLDYLLHPRMFIESDLAPG